MRRITANGATFNVFECGAGPAVVFLHGFPLNHTMWRGQLAALAANNRLIAPDLRGFGGSSVTDGTVTMEKFADDVAALLDALGIHQPVCLCGLSMGGYIAFQFVRKYPDRVRSLVLADTRSQPDTPEGAQGRRATAETVLAKGSGAILEPMLAKLLDPRTAANHPAVAQAVSEMIRGADPRAIAAALRGMAERPDSTPLLSSIKVRTLVVVGETDSLAPPAEMRAMAEQIPQATFVVIPDAGHMAPMENPAAVNEALLAFLANELHAR